MRNLKRICALSLCVAVLCTSCGTKHSEVSVEKPNIISHQGEDGNYDIIEKPTGIDGERLYNKYVTVNGTEYPRMILKLIKDDMKTFEYIEYQLEDDFSWTRSKLPWSDKVSALYEDGTGTIVSDSQGNLYASTYDKDGMMIVLRLSEDGKVQELDLTEVEKVYDQVHPTSFDIINDHELVFFYEENPEETGMKTNVVFFDSIKECVVDKGLTISNDVVFDKDGYYYSVSPEQQVIQKYTIHDTLPHSVIKCGEMSGLVNITDLLIDEDNGYIKISSGIYGGTLDDAQWELMLPVENMYYDKGVEQFDENPLTAFMSYIKVSGDDCEFFVETLRSDDILDFAWVHYRCD